MLDLTDPKLAHLVARYRAWVREQNTLMRDKYADNPPIYYATYSSFLDWCVREGIEVPEEADA